MNKELTYDKTHEVKLMLLLETKCRVLEGGHKKLREKKLLSHKQKLSLRDLGGFCYVLKGCDKLHERVPL